MPLYHILHTCPLTEAQKDALAESITAIHSTRFTTPRMFVNVDFQDVRAVSTYVGGRRQLQGNHIHANVRSGPSRSQADWDELCAGVAAAWDREVASQPLPRAKGTPEQDVSLRSVIVLGGMIAGVEAGFPLPPAGGDVAWLRENWAAFNQKADAGDEEMQGLVREVKERGLMEGGANGLKSAARKLEDMLGWGDSA